MRKILILVLSALRPPWNAMLRKQKETWDSVPNENTDTLYYVGACNPPRYEDRVWHSEIDEHLHNIGRRTVEALEYALQRKDWQFLARPHSSTYVHKRRLVDYISKLPATGILGGLVVPAGPHDGPWLWGGGHFIMSRDVVERVVAAKGQWDHTIMEDVALSKLGTALGIPFTSILSSSVNPSDKGAGWDMICYNGAVGGFGFTDFAEVDKAHDQYFFRCKQDADRTVDLQTMDLLFKHLTP